MFYLYHEGIAKKGSNEVRTFLWDYIRNCIPPRVKKLHLYSDNCGGQNKNFTAIAFLSALRDSGRFDEIRHLFPVRGHSFMPCDRDFNVAKTFIRKTDRIYSLKQFYEIDH